MLESEAVRMEFPSDANIIVGQSHFIKTVEDLYEAMSTTVPQAKFGFPTATPEVVPAVAAQTGKTSDPARPVANGFGEARSPAESPLPFESIPDCSVTGCPVCARCTEPIS